MVLPKLINKQISRPVAVANIIKTVITPSVTDPTPFIYNDANPGDTTSVIHNDRWTDSSVETDASPLLTYWRNVPPVIS